MASNGSNPEPVTLRCQCNCAWATIEDGYLWVRSRHHGKHHVNGVPLALLAAMAAGTATPEMMQPVSYAEPRPTAQGKEYMGELESDLA